jgi:metal-responsive CopG/Arc/MetJ family transcriptional regulator
MRYDGGLCCNTVIGIIGIWQHRGFAKRSEAIASLIERILSNLSLIQLQCGNMARFITITIDHPHEPYPHDDHKFNHPVHFILISFFASTHCSCPSFINGSFDKHQCFFLVS